MLLNEGSVRAAEVPRLPQAPDFVRLVAMRFRGTLKNWNDERGFGFISPEQGGHDVFVHIKSFREPRQRPQVGQAVTFEVELGPDGRQRACAVEPLRSAGATRLRRRDGPARWGAATTFVIGGFLALYLVIALVWSVPNWVPALYVVASIVAFLVYGADKFAAVSRRWRVSEQTLLVIGLLGGWPGAIVAQQILRHKTTKVAFRAAFWVTVVLNVIAFIALSSPLARQVLMG